MKEMNKCSSLSLKVSSDVYEACFIKRIGSDISLNTSFESIWDAFNTPIKVFIKNRINNDQEENATLNNEIAQCLKNLLQNLPHKYRQALILTEFEHLTLKELALQVGISVSGAESRV